ncbi:MAG TPA: CDP-alcohol phosphatidyltransferase family protein [Woeseiaceae bacterium]|nr:CDP-alcohol phosphatidyltransferase family protein [Woeseiaceae bacterium]
MANLITLSRLLLLIVVVAIAYQPYSWWHVVNIALLIIVFVTDGLDGYVARKRGEESVFGAMFDIASDRITELTMWIVLLDLDIVPVWVPLVFIIRGTVVDTIRANQVTAEHDTPFSMLRTPLGKWVVAGKFMRIFYAVLKATTFCWLLLMEPLPVLLPVFRDWMPVLDGIGAGLVYLSVLICVIRGLPVIMEFAYKEKDTFVPKRVKLE